VFVCVCVWCVCVWGGGSVAITDKPTADSDTYIHVTPQLLPVLPDC
jgi:hypothetical protein